MESRFKEHISATIKIQEEIKRELATLASKS